MSISLSITGAGQPPEQARTVPIATMSVFDRYWAPPARALELRWIPLFRTGFPLAHCDIESVLDELTSLRRSIQASGPEASEVVLPRIDRLVTELRSIDSGTDLYIG